MECAFDTIGAVIEQHMDFIQTIAQNRVWTRWALNGEVK